MFTGVKGHFLGGRTVSFFSAIFMFSLEDLASPRMTFDAIVS